MPLDPSPAENPREPRRRDPAEGLDESALIARCRADDREAQRRFYELHSRRIYGLALRMLRNEDDAFEITQETFLRAFQRIRTFHERARIGTWLYRIATNEALQLLRRRATERKHRRSIAETHAARNDLTTHDARADLQSALDRLSDTARAILLLRYQQSLDYARIAEVLQCAPGTVASRLNRARANLRAILEDRPPQREENGVTPHLTQGIGDAPGPSKRHPNPKARPR